MSAMDGKLTLAPVQFGTDKRRLDAVCRYPCFESLRLAVRDDRWIRVIPTGNKNSSLRTRHAIWSGPTPHWFSACRPRAKSALGGGEEVTTAEHKQTGYKKNKARSHGLDAGKPADLCNGWKPDTGPVTHRRGCSSQVYMRSRSFFTSRPGCS